MMLSTEVRMTSREIAELTGKQHKNVIADCRTVFEALNLQSADFSADYIDSRGRAQKEFILDRDLTMTLVMGYSIPLRHRVARRLRELESTLHSTGIPVPTLATSSADTIAAGVALLDGSRKLLHISDSSVLAGLRKLQSAAGLPDLLPGYAVDAPPDATGGSSEPTASLRQLLTEHGIKLSSQKAYARLAELGIVEQKTRTSTRGEKHYWCLTEAGLAYGKNLTSPGNPRATQPHFYESKFSVICKMITNNIQ